MQSACAAPLLLQSSQQLFLVSRCAIEETMPGVFLRGALSSPTPEAFPCHGSLLPIILRPGSPSHPYAVKIWTSMVGNPDAAAVAPLRDVFDAQLGISVVVRLMGFLSETENDVLFIRRMNCHRPFTNVSLRGTMHPRVRSIALVSASSLMARIVLDVLMAHGSPQNTSTLVNLLTDVFESMSLGDDGRVHIQTVGTTLLMAVS